MKTLILEASGHICFSWKSEQAISHFRHPLHFESSLAIHIGSFFFAIPKPLEMIGISLGVYFDLSVMFVNGNFFK